ncbi:MAG: hypothetical protein C4541_11555 [Candidatus Auribacter fodinae]|uniref:Uncharacterized protein n=1 Tax=Candidatus Auribacter fodinae TaxID=2093366 RepID=A0A3A4QVP9_9BACT|nr:MAG: hypothetical protein C4541_11555 [Candidatus Auribacter fodinae]
MGGLVLFDAVFDADDVQKRGCPVALVGCQDVSGGVLARARAVGVQVYPVRVLIEDLPSACDGLMELARSWDSFQVELRERVLDRAFCARGSFGGLATREVLYVIERLRILQNYAGGCVAGEDASLRLAFERALGISR